VSEPVAGPDGPSLSRVFPEGFDAIHDRLLRQLDPRRPREQWRRLFDYAWRRSEDPVGYAISERDEPVGFIGTVLSERTVGGRLERFCNVTSWVARPSHRAEATLLVMPLRDLRDHTVTNLTCNEAVFRIFSMLGFEVLETETLILLPTPALLVPRRGCRIVSDPRAIEAALDDAEVRVLRDHLPYARHLLLTAGDGQCYVVYTLARRRRVPTARLHHISDAAVFRRLWPTLQRRLLRRHGVVLAECDARLLARVEVPGGIRVRRRVPRVFKSPRLRAEQVDSLYSEVVLLNLP
jgi:hypothetical protein